MPTLRSDCEVDLLRKDWEKQRRLIGALETEVFGARLAAKYLDKVGLVGLILIRDEKLRDQKL